MEDQTLGRRGAHRHLGWRAAQCGKAGARQPGGSGAAPNLCQTTPSTPQLWFPHRAGVHPRQGAWKASLVGRWGVYLSQGVVKGQTLKCPAVMGQLDGI